MSRALIEPVLYQKGWREMGTVALLRSKLCIVGIAFLLVGCSSIREGREYAAAKSEDTESAYLAFLAAHPNGDPVLRAYAESRIKEINEQKVKETPCASADRFFASVKTGDTEAVRAYASQGCDVLVQYRGFTALHWTRTADMTRLLLGLGVDPKVADGNGFTPLHAAAQVDAPEVIEILVGAGLDVNVRTNSTPDHIGRGTALSTAAAVGSTRALQALLAAGADVNARDEADRTALDFATANGQVEAASLLKAHGGTKSAQFAKMNVKKRAEELGIGCHWECVADAGCAAPDGFPPTKVDGEFMLSAIGGEMRMETIKKGGTSTPLARDLHPALTAANGWRKKCPDY